MSESTPKTFFSSVDLPAPLLPARTMVMVSFVSVSLVGKGEVSAEASGSYRVSFGFTLVS